MADSYIPRSQSGAANWLRTFATVIGRDPLAYHLGVADAAAIQSAVNAFDAAYLLTTHPSTRTLPAIAGKDDARAAAERVCQQYYVRIKADDGVSDALKFNAGVRPMNRGRSRIQCPPDAPMLAVISVTPGRHVLQYHNVDSSAARKPFGAIGLQLMMKLADATDATEATDADGPIDARLQGTYTRNPMTVHFDRHDDLKIATYVARWCSRRGDTGAWSAPVSMRVVA